MSVERVEVKDVRVPEQLMRAMAAEAEAAREARAKVIAAEGEHKASKSLMMAAQNIGQSPLALQVRSILFKFMFRALLIRLCQLKTAKPDSKLFTAEISANTEQHRGGEQQHRHLPHPHRHHQSNVGWCEELCRSGPLSLISQ